MIFRQITYHFYYLMDADPAYAQLRDLHAEDLASMRVFLACFLNAWLGGPRDWFVEHPGVCMMSSHARLSITRATAASWEDARRRAVTAAAVDTGCHGQETAATNDVATTRDGKPGQTH